MLKLNYQPQKNSTNHNSRSQSGLRAAVDIQNTGPRHVMSALIGEAQRGAVSAIAGSGSQWRRRNSDPLTHWLKGSATWCDGTTTWSGVLEAILKIVNKTGDISIRVSGSKGAEEIWKMDCSMMVDADAKKGNATMSMRAKGKTIGSGAGSMEIKDKTGTMDMLIKDADSNDLWSQTGNMMMDTEAKKCTMGVNTKLKGSEFIGGQGEFKIIDKKGQMSATATHEGKEVWSHTGDMTVPACLPACLRTARLCVCPSIVRSVGLFVSCTTCSSVCSSSPSLRVASIRPSMMGCVCWFVCASGCCLYCRLSDHPHLSPRLLLALPLADSHA